jgi:transcriptional regulator with XRE-family HTH domain
MNIRAYRTALGISQSKLARISSVSRFRISTYELGGGYLTSEEQNRIREALRLEAERLRNIPTIVEFPQDKMDARLWEVR